MTYNVSIKRLLAVLLLWVGWTLPSPAGLTSTNATLEAWMEQLQTNIAQPRFENAQWGIKVVSLDSGQTLFEHNSRKFFQPASNAKLFTAALVLDRLGPDYRISTSICSTVQPDAEGVLHGDVYVIGRGDPTFSSRWHDGDTAASLAPLIDIFKDIGVRRIEGRLIGDASYLHNSARARGWMWEDMEHAYGPRLSALSFNNNLVQLRVSPGSVAGSPCRVTSPSSDTELEIINRTTTADTDPEEIVAARRLLGTDIVVVSGQLMLAAEPETLSIPVPFPAQFFMDNLAAELERQGIRITGSVGVRPMRDSARQTQHVLGSVRSPTMTEILHETMKQSDNLAAALLFAHAETRFQSEWESLPQAKGSQLMIQFLQQRGLPADEVLIEEGSGLSRNSLVTPNALVALLVHMHGHAAAEDFRQSLPIAGVDGTLKNRFVKTPAQGRLHAKTGTLRWAQALSGCATSQAGENLAFSILLNRYSPTDSNPTATEEVDAVALILTDLQVRSSDE